MTLNPAITAKSNASKADRVRKMLADFRQNDPLSGGFDLRMSLARIIVDHLKEKGWTQAALAAKAGMEPPQLSPIVNAEANCTFDVAGRILFALGIVGQIVEIPPNDGGVRHGSTAEGNLTLVRGSWYGEEGTSGKETLRIIRTDTNSSRPPLRLAVSG